MDEVEKMIEDHEASCRAYGINLEKGSCGKADDLQEQRTRSAVLDAFTRLRSERDAAVAIVRTMEWNGVLPHLCPLCKRSEPGVAMGYYHAPGHALDCRIGRLLAESETDLRNPADCRVGSNSAYRQGFEDCRKQAAGVAHAQRNISPPGPARQASRFIEDAVLALADHPDTSAGQDSGGER